MVQQNSSHYRAFIVAASILTSVVLLRSRKRTKSAVGLLLAESKVVLIRTVEELERWISLLRTDICSGSLVQGHYILGLDSEWKPKRERDDCHRTSVLQLSGPSITLVIQIQLALRDEVFGTSLYNLLRDDSILKVGVGIGHDVSKLKRDFKLQTRAYLDISHLANWIWHIRPGLLKICEKCLGVNWGGKKGSGSNTITMSDWSVEHLSEEQLLYAASDSFISRKCFFALLDEEVFRRRSPEDIKKWFDKHRRLDPPERKAKPRQKERKNNQDRSRIGNDKKSRRRQETLDKRSRQKNLYEYCRLEDPNGQLLAHCNERKINWYLQRKLGIIISDSPLTLRLNFSASKKRHFGYHENKFYLEKKLNICVVCSRDEKLARHHVVPLYYRKYFPEYLRSHCSHDIVLLCVSCRMKIRDQELFDAISRETGIPINIPKFINYPEIVAAKRAARVLLRPDSTDKLPATRKRKLEDICASFLSKTGEGVNTPDLLAIMELPSRVVASDYVPPGKLIVDMMSLEELRTFIRRWRQFFLDTMQPQFLSQHWSVDAER